MKTGVLRQSEAATDTWKVPVAAFLRGTSMDREIPQGVYYTQEEQGNTGRKKPYILQ